MDEIQRVAAANIGVIDSTNKENNKEGRRGNWNKDEPVRKEKQRLRKLEVSLLFAVKLWSLLYEFLPRLSDSVVLYFVVRKLLQSNPWPSKKRKKEKKEGGIKEKKRKRPVESLYTVRAFWPEKRERKRDTGKRRRCHSKQEWRLILRGHSCISDLSLSPFPATTVPSDVAFCFICN